MKDRIHARLEHALANLRMVKSLLAEDVAFGWEYEEVNRALEILEYVDIVINED